MIGKGRCSDFRDIRPNAGRAAHKSYDERRAFGQFGYTVSHDLEAWHGDSKLKDNP